MSSNIIPYVSALGGRFAKECRGWVQYVGRRVMVNRAFFFVATKISAVDSHLWTNIKKHTGSAKYLSLENDLKTFTTEHFPKILFLFESTILPVNN